MARMLPLSKIDADAVEALLDAAFGADRKARTAYKLRIGVSAVPALSFAVVDDDALLGTIQCWPVRIASAPLVLVGPVAVAPNAQGKGLGKALMDVMLAAADAHGFDALMMIGDPEYYGRFFGFSAEATVGWVLPGPVARHRLLARITRPGGVPAKGDVLPDLSIATTFATGATSA
jgi:predicted N-acetyltransferase YhbS